VSQFCRACSGSLGRPLFQAAIFEKNVNYYECSICGYVQTESPDWLDKAYSAAINSCDTGIMARNQANLNVVVATLSVLGRLNDAIVDCAGGYGILVRLLRDRGVNAHWSDPYCSNLLALGFEHTSEQAGLVTAFEAFEHFFEPMLEIEKLFSISPNLLISTCLIPTPTPKPNEWWYYGLDHGQHIGFFRLKTLQFIARKFNKYLVSDGVGCHLFTDKPVSHIKWNLAVRLSRRLHLYMGESFNQRLGMIL